MSQFSAQLPSFPLRKCPTSTVDVPFSNLIDGQVIGAVGVGGATGEQDAEIAQAGVEKLTSAIWE